MPAVITSSPQYEVVVPVGVFFCWIGQVEIKVAGNEGTVTVICVSLHALTVTGNGITGPFVVARYVPTETLPVPWVAPKP